MTSPSKTPGLGAIFLVVFLDILGFSLVLPFLAKRRAPRSTRASSPGRSSRRSTRSCSSCSCRYGYASRIAWAGGRCSSGASRDRSGHAGLGFGALDAQTSCGSSSRARRADRYGEPRHRERVHRGRDEARGAREGMGMIGMAFGLGFILGPASAARSRASPSAVAPARCPASRRVALPREPRVGVLRLLSRLPPERRATTKRSPRAAEPRRRARCLRASRRRSRCW